jgi:hypothetical protein
LQATGGDTSKILQIYFASLSYRAHRLYVPYPNFEIEPEKKEK